MSDFSKLNSNNGYREVQCIYIGSKEAQSKAPAIQTAVIRKQGESREAFLKRHSRKCQVCHHPCRDAIEGAFVIWRRPRGIAEVYGLRGDSLYRHAVAFDLFTQRRSNLRSVLENIMERGVETEITGETILGALKAYTCLDDSNRWIEPTSNVVFSTKSAEARTSLPNIGLSALPESGAGSSQPLDASPELPQPNRNSQELKFDVTL